MDGERANAGLHPHVLNQVLARQPDRAARILDLGCGSGALLRRLATCGYTDLHGIDIACPGSTEPALRFIEADLDRPRLPFADGSLDLVLCIEFIEHAENPGALVAELARVLAPTGRVLLTTPNLHSVEARLRWLALGRLKQFDAIGDPTHITPIVLQPFTRLLARHGLSVLERWGFPEDGRSPTSRPALRAAARLLRLLGLAGEPAGDQLCLLLGHAGGATPPHDKRALLTAHYR